MDVVTAARRYLAAQSSITALLGSDATYETWIFRWKPYVDVQGTGSALLVVRQQGSWAGANMHNTMRFPRLVVDVYADVQRAVGGSKKGNIAQAATGEDTALQISTLLDALLHLPGGEDVHWGASGDDPGLRIIKTLRSGEPELRELVGGDGVMVATNTYQVTVG